MKNEELNLDEISFTTVNKDGLEVECDAVASYYDEENDKLYVVFTDYSIGKNDLFNYYINEISGEEGNYKLTEIEDKELRLRLINETLEKEII